MMPLIPHSGDEAEARRSSDATGSRAMRMSDGAVRLRDRIEPVSKSPPRAAGSHGFRPGNPEVPVKAADSPFVAYQRFGLRTDIGEICEIPRAEVMTNLLASWQRARGR